MQAIHYLRAFRDGVFIAGLVPSAALAQKMLNVCNFQQNLPTSTVSAINTQNDLVLADGQIVRLSGIESPNWRVRGQNFAPLARVWLQQNLMGRQIAYSATLVGLDRWRRVQALVFLSQNPSQSVQSALLTTGLAQVWAHSSIPCQAGFLRDEAFARDQGLGIWSDDDHAEIDPALPDAFKNLDGHDIVVRGKVISVQTVKYRTYIRFGFRKYKDLAAIILKPDLKAFLKAGNSPQYLIGHTIRLRGRLDTQFGPQIDIAGAAQIEIIDSPSIWPLAAKTSEN